MGKIYLYELRRLVWNRVFLGLAAVVLGYGWVTLTGEILLGVENTAPFSPVSFGAYCQRLGPVILVGELFFLSFLVRGRGCREIVAATPVDGGRLLAVRLGAAVTGTLLLWGLGAGVALGFYAAVFQWTGFGLLVVPWAMAAGGWGAAGAAIGWMLRGMVS
ncbi:MAG: hypothetical protein HFF90_10670 [Oscillibacter sp.]|nr:hypothetical protein [Oscillibacter sp.]